MTSIPTGAVPSTDERTQLRDVIAEREEHFHKSERRWNFWYYGCTYGAVLFSALAALVLKLKAVTGSWQEDCGAIFATAAAILGTAMGTGNFERRWRAARHARTMLRQLSLRLIEHDANLKQINHDLQEALVLHDDEVVGRDKANALPDALRGGPPNKDTHSA